MRAAVFASVVLALALACGPADAAHWKVQRVATRADVYEIPGLAGNARGDAALLFRTESALWLAVARRGKPFGRARRVPGGGSVAEDPYVPPDVAIDERGNVLVTWSYFDNTEPEEPEARDDGCCYGLRLSVFHASNRRFGRTQTLTPRGHTVFGARPVIARGRVGVAWTQDDGRPVRVRLSRRGGRLGRPISLGHGDRAFAIALLRHGAAVTFGNLRRGKFVLREARLRGRRVVKDRGLGARIPEFAEATVETNARGDEAAAWGGGFDARSFPLYAATRRLGGRFRPQRLVRHRGAEDPPSIAVAPSGAVVVGWRTVHVQHALAVTTVAGHQFGRVRAFFRHFTTDLTTAVNSAGRALVAWGIRTPPHRSPRLRAGFRGRDGRPVGVRRFGRFDALAPHGTVDGRGRARIAWLRGSRVMAARRR